MEIQFWTLSRRSPAITTNIPFKKTGLKVAIKKEIDRLRGKTWFSISQTELILKNESRIIDCYLNQELKWLCSRLTLSGHIYLITVWWTKNQPI